MMCFQLLYLLVLPIPQATSSLRSVCCPATLHSVSDVTSSQPSLCLSQINYFSRSLEQWCLPFTTPCFYCHLSSVLQDDLILIVHKNKKAPKQKLPTSLPIP